MASPLFSKNERLKMMGEYLTALYRKRLNDDHKFTVSAWAREMGVSQSNLTRMLDGELNIGEDYLRRITDALGSMRLYDLAGYVRPDPLLWSILGLWDELMDEDRRELLEMAKKRAAQNRG